MLGVLHTTPFTIPSTPVLKRAPPKGTQWLHEVTFNGWRAQLHRAGNKVTIFMRGSDYTGRMPDLRDSLGALPARSAIIDAEIVLCETDGKPDLKALKEGRAGDLCAWCFDLLELDRHDLRQLPLIERKAKLRDLLIAADDHVLRYSEEFPDARKLLAVADKAGLEGVVSKLKHQLYRSGRNSGWIKVRCAPWRNANRDRDVRFWLR